MNPIAMTLSVNSLMKMIENTMSAFLRKPDLQGKIIMMSDRSRMAKDKVERVETARLECWDQVLRGSNQVETR